MGRLVLAAALVALVLSACATMAAAIRLPSTTPCKWGHNRDASGNCADTCAIRNCGTNSKCLKDEAGWANCVCLKGFQLLPNASCAHSCAILVCDPHATCVKEEDSLAKCVCNWGYVMTPDGVCIDTCANKACDGTCTKDAAGAAVCHCNNTIGLVLLEDTKTCKDACEVAACRTNFTCARNPDNLADVNCECQEGYALSGDKCIDKCDIKGCLGGTCSQIDGEAVCDCHGATTGLKLLEDTVTCQDACVLEACRTNFTCARNVDNLANVRCECEDGYALAEDGTCIDKCDLKGCLGGTCSQIDGEAVCDCHGATTGLKLLEDTVTCQDACEVAACRTNFTCARNPDNLADVNCECQEGYALSGDKCIDKCDLKGCLGGTCSQIDGEAVCDCHGATTGLKLLEDTVTCQDACVLEACRTNFTCARNVDNLADVRCECEDGYALAEDGTCIDKCDLKGCLGGGTCSQIDGVAVCDCDMETSGKVLLADTITCKDACQVKGCATLGDFGQCIRNPMNASDVRCACKDGYVLSGGICVDACELEACAIKDIKSECIRNPLNLTDVHCACVEGYVLSGGKCTDACLVQACATKDTKSECLVNPQNKTDVHCACLNNYVLSGGVCTDTCALKGCVGGTCDHNTDGSAFCYCNADAGFVLLGDKLTCEHVCTIANCKNKDPNSFCTWTKAGGATCPCMLGFNTPVGGGLCTDTCTLKGCGAHSTCKHRDDGSAFCVCDTGYTLQEDGVTCKDNCAILMDKSPCTGVNEQCAKNATGWASCVCKPYYHTYKGYCANRCIDKPKSEQCPDNSYCVRRVDGIAFCICNDPKDAKSSGAGGCGTLDGLGDTVNATWTGP
ncbi:hypothetical protein CLOM_g3946 [Closterium sp. NIES-68]|nr:hypothetical protein CLOM_g3946 [Closterium sp. NIES-68]